MTSTTITRVASTALHPEYAHMAYTMIPSPTVATLLDAWRADHALHVLHPDIRCADCGAYGERTGHMGCQYPQDHD